MGLSEQLISQFVKITNDTDTTKQETTVFGTIAEQNGIKYVRLDGSEILTPIASTTTADDGDRVTVMIKNHTAIVTGNLTNPSVSSSTTTHIYNKITEFEIAIGHKVDVTELNAQSARIDTLVSDNATIRESLTAANANIKELQTDNATVKDTLSAANADITKLQATNATITDKLNAASANINSLQSDNAVIKNELIAANARIDDIKATVITVEYLDANYAKVSDLEADYVKVNELESKVGSFDYLKASMADISYAKIDFANVVGQVVGTEIIKDGAITNAKIVSLSANKLTAGVIDASKIIVQNLNADNITVGTINGQLIGTGSVGLDRLSEEVTTSEQFTTYVTSTDEEISSIKNRTKTVEDSLVRKVDVSDFNSVKQTIDSNSASIAQLVEDVELKVDGSVVTELENRTSDIEQNLNSFKVSIEETYTTKEEFDNLTFVGLNLVNNSKTMFGALIKVYLMDEDENLLTNEIDELLYI